MLTRRILTGLPPLLLSNTFKSPDPDSEIIVSGALQTFPTCWWSIPVPSTYVAVDLRVSTSPKVENQHKLMMRGAQSYRSLLWCPRTTSRLTCCLDSNLQHTDVRGQPQQTRLVLLKTHSSALVRLLELSKDVSSFPII